MAFIVVTGGEQNRGQLHLPEKQGLWFCKTMYQELKDLKPHFLDGVHGLRALAAIAVVVFHAGGALSAEKYQGLIWLQPITKSLSTGVDIFFVISGFVISLPFFLGRMQPVDHYFFGRILRIYPMAMLTAFIYLVFNLVIFGRSADIDVLVSSFLLIPSATDPVPIVLWTLKQELLFYALFGLVYIQPILGLSIVFFWAILSPFMPVYDFPLLSWMFHPKNVEFGFGIAAAYAYVFHKLSPRRSLVTGCFGLIAFVVIGVITSAGGVSRGVEVLLLGGTGFMTIYGFASAGRRLPSLVIFLGTASYSIYLIHYFFISAFNKVLSRFAPDLPGFLALSILVVAATFMGCVYYTLFERPIENWRKNLRFSKAKPS